MSEVISQMAASSLASMSISDQGLSALIISSPDGGRIRGRPGNDQGCTIELKFLRTLRQ
jgi:hypothetical protein